MGLEWRLGYLREDGITCVWGRVFEHVILEIKWFQASSTPSPEDLTTVLWPVPDHRSQQSPKMNAAQSFPGNRYQQDFILRWINVADNQCGWLAKYEREKPAQFHAAVHPNSLQNHDFNPVFTHKLYSPINQSPKLFNSSEDIAGIYASCTKN